MGLQNYSFTLGGEHFKTTYLLYVLRLRNKETDQYYIGQTGDNNHLTSRSAFRRLAGHFEDSNTSTQNKLYRHIVKELLEPYGIGKEINREVKAKVEEVMVASEVTVFVYPLMDFNHLQILPRIHKEKVKMVKEFEKYIIKWFDNQGYTLINGLRSNIVYPIEKLFPEKYEEIKLDFPGEDNVEG